MEKNGRIRNKRDFSKYNLTFKFYMDLYMYICEYMYVCMYIYLYERKGRREEGGRGEGKNVKPKMLRLYRDGNKPAFISN